MGYGADLMKTKLSTDLELVMRAAAAAAAAHANQRRKASDQPYVNHLIRVALKASEFGLPSEVVAAGLLHDIVEDTEVTIEDLREEFPKRVVELVGLLTQWWPDDAPRAVKDAEATKYYEAILSDPDAVNLKLLDRADNLLDMIDIIPRARAWAEKYLRRSEVELLDVYKASSNEKAKIWFKDSIETLRLALGKE